MSLIEIYLLIGLVLAIVFVVIDWYDGADLKIRDFVAVSLLISGWLLILPLVFGVDVIRFLKRKLNWSINFNSVIVRGRRK